MNSPHDITKDPQFVSLYPEVKWTRRSFVVSSLATGFALAVQPVSAQTITTDAQGLTAGEVKIPTKDGEMPGYRAMPANAKNAPLILVDWPVIHRLAPGTRSSLLGRVIRCAQTRRSTGSSPARPLRVGRDHLL